MARKNKTRCIHGLSISGQRAGDDTCLVCISPTGSGRPAGTEVAELEHRLRHAENQNTIDRDIIAELDRRVQCLLAVMAVYRCNLGTVEEVK